MLKRVEVFGVIIPIAVLSFSAVRLSAIPQVLINEIYYDSPGSDKHTFTELKGAAGASLDSVYLIGVNGRNGDVYTTITLSGYSIPADNYFVVGQDTGVQNIDLVSSKADWQNGSDNVLLIHISNSDTSVLDAVGYGDFTGSDTFFVGESSPAHDVDAGHSIVRYPDGRDTNNNGTDFVDFPIPTPGLSNLISDVAVDSIMLPDTIYKDSTYSPCALVKNKGDKDETFKTICFIDVYTDTVELTLNAKKDSIVIFKEWIVPDTSRCVVTVSVLLAGDMDTTNNSKTKVVISTVGVEEDSDLTPNIFKLHQNRPNPGLGRTEILYKLPTTCRVKLTIYDQTGRIVRKLVDRVEEPGCRRIIWNGLNENGKEVTTGIYFCELEAYTDPGTGNYTDAKKILMLR